MKPREFRLTELDPEFLRYESRSLWRQLRTIHKATGLKFLCPKCFLLNAGPIGMHSIICWSPKVPSDATPGPGRWNLVGTDFSDLSLVAGSSSVRLSDGCRWHGFVKKGVVTHCDDAFP